MADMPATDEPITRYSGVQSLAEVVGDNCKRLRSGLGITQDELARYARSVGLRWRASSVGDFEAGRSAPSLATVLAVAAALQSALKERRSGRKRGQGLAGVSVGDLVRSDQPVAVTELLTLPGATLAAWLGDTFADAPSISNDAALESQMDRSESYLVGSGAVMERSGLAEERMAKSLGVDLRTLSVASFHLWDRTFTEERDQRAGPDANKQKRGQVTRTMRAELAAVVKDMVEDTKGKG